jgi:hypothetical protein
MVGLSFCDFAGTREEKAMMATYRQQQWPRRYKVMPTFSFSLILYSFSVLLQFYERMVDLSSVTNALFEYMVHLLLTEWISLMVTSTRKEKRRPLSA